MRVAVGPSRGKQPFFDSVQTFPCGFGERGIGAYYIANHLPGGEVERALGRRAHGQRNRALRTETDALRRRLLPRPHSDCLREEVDRDRFLAGLELTAAAKAIQAVQKTDSVSQLASPQKGHRHSAIYGIAKAMPGYGFHVP